MQGKRSLAISQFSQQQHFIGKLAAGLFRIDQPAVDHDLVDATIRFDQFCCRSKHLCQFRRQTGSALTIVSPSTVFNTDLHKILPG